MGDNPPKKKLATGTSGQLPSLGNSSNTNNASNSLPLKKQDYEKIGRAAFKLVAQNPQTDQEQRKRTRPDELPVINITRHISGQLYSTGIVLPVRYRPLHLATGTSTVGPTIRRMLQNQALQGETNQHFTQLLKDHHFPTIIRTVCC